ncbi:PBP1A family penicillin-binding protein [Persephonella atlantica]|uniref:PBP1A family penicillin-binding protein n=1 Tax=Persephonella atlantica TaxID=2699429 RepID=A0ABS1GGZ8_9AQUI|nr:PBP1A family penicillin-binding protein [Persephonella atlantica]MBK3332156.1 PBP1A family penicillin-binding protein [Persephonella atlantica]
MLRYLKFFLLLTVLVGLCGTALFVYINTRNLPDVRNLEHWKPSQVSQVFAHDGSLLTEFYIQRRQYVSIDEIPEHVKKAFIAIEDRTFYENPGIDIWGILRAALINIVSGRIVAGGSTISQQLIKNLFLTPERSFRRKFKEMILAIKLNRIYPKDKILEMYLNQIYLGHGAYGVESASQVYFGKHVWELDVCEAAVLAGLPKAPSRYDPYKNMEGAIQRRNVVLQSMVEEGYIDIYTAKECYEKPIVLREKDEEDVNIHDYFTEMVRQWFANRYGIDELYKGGYKIYTTADKDLLRDTHYIVKDHIELLQQQVGFPKLSEEEINKMLEEYSKQNTKKLLKDHVYVGLIEDIKGKTVLFKVGERKGKVRFYGSLKNAQKGLPIYVRYIGDNRFEFVPYLETAVVSIDPQTGAIRALSGGYDFKKSKYNRAVQAKRQPGSAFKPIVYTAAIMKGFSQISVIDDEPVAIWDPDRFEEWIPRNYEGEYHGKVTLREALTKSLNAASVNLFLEIGYEPVISLAYRLGIKTKIPKVPSVALGSVDVSPLELASVYSTFANNGVRCKPYFIEKVVDPNGNVIYQHEPECSTVIPEEENAVMVDLLKGVIQEGTGKKARILGFPIAGKTGTTNDYTDAWFAGFSTKLTTVVWVGYDFKKKIGWKMTGAKAALPIWIDLMATAHADREITDFPVPQKTTYIPIDLKTQTVSDGNCENKKLLFIKGTEPKIDCSGNIITVPSYKKEEEFLFDINKEGKSDEIPLPGQ